LEGTGTAIVNGHKKSLKAGTMMLIQAADGHRPLAVEDGERVRAACLP
jgi:quercetin dioxygenase-like cupin family protein